MNRIGSLYFNTKFVKSKVCNSTYKAFPLIINHHTMASFQIQIISETLIKPSSPTPPSLKQHRFSDYDKTMHHMYIPAAFLYTSHGHGITSTDEVSQLLKNSLSKTLSHYYHFAGRLVGDSHVDCNDMGVKLFEVRVRCPMTEVLKRPNTDAKDLVFPKGLPWSMGEGDILVVAQITYFDCGGIAISTDMSHKIVDVSSIATFMKDWAAMARNSSHQPYPVIVSPTILPMDDIPATAEDDIMKENICQSRRFLFDDSKIVELKAMAANSGVENPTRVEVVTAILHKCAVTASTTALGSFMPNILLLAVNLRSIVSPPLANTSIGNISSCCAISVTHENQMKFPLLVGELRRSKTKLLQNYGKQLKKSELLFLNGTDKAQKLSDGDSFDCFIFTSWCRSPLYEVDFGWGRPVQVYVPSCPIKNTFRLTDTPAQDGIQALVTLEENVMPIFENDEELLAFASLIKDS
uniref:17,18-epoxy-17-hydroxycur-19-ene N-malonyltransferase n=1 Tax=Strychnos nux-vomica TaxID=28545 RepID=AT_STRNX|nr:acetyltransferase [Strychnos nux-vomica]